MNDNIYELNEDGTEVWFNDEPMELIDVVARLNQLDYAKRQIKKELDVKNDLCKAYEKTYQETNKQNRLYRAEILELQNILTDYESQEIEGDINYWKGVEKAYTDLLNEYYSKIIELEKDNFYLELKIEELEDDLL